MSWKLFVIHFQPLFLSSPPHHLFYKSGKSPSSIVYEKCVNPLLGILQIPNTPSISFSLSIFLWQHKHTHTHTHKLSNSFSHTHTSTQTYSHTHARAHTHTRIHPRNAVVNFTNILWAHLRQDSCAKRSSNLKCKYKKSFAQNFCTKKARVKRWWNWRTEKTVETETRFDTSLVRLGKSYLSFKLCFFQKAFFQLKVRPQRWMKK